MDHLTKDRRSWNMSRIRSKDTKPEIIVRSLLHNLGYRFRLHRKDLPGSPDIVLPKYRTVVLVHGCFWHRHQGCKYSYSPKSKKAFWEKKFQSNVLRDEQNTSKLEDLGWNVVIVWECETADIDLLTNKLHEELSRCNQNIQTQNSPEDIL